MKKHMSSQVIPCKRCSKRLRVPIKPGKRLSVECAGCGLEFIVSFKSPFYEVFQFDGKKSLGDNLKQSLRRYGQLPDNARLKLMALVCLFTLFVLVLLGGLVFAFS